MLPTGIFKYGENNHMFRIVAQTNLYKKQRIRLDDSWKSLSALWLKNTLFTIKTHNLLYHNKLNLLCRISINDFSEFGSLPMLLCYKKPISIAEVFPILSRRIEVLPEPVLSTLTVSLPSIPCERSELISQPPKEILLWVIIPMRTLSSASTASYKHPGLLAHMWLKTETQTQGREGQARIQVQVPFPHAKCCISVLLSPRERKSSTIIKMITIITNNLQSKNIFQLYT